MILVNDTQLEAQLLSTVIDEDRLAASVLARVTYELPETSRSRPEPPLLELAAQQVWPVALAPTDTAHGKMETDQPFMKGGVDLFLFGVARSPGRAPVREMEVRFDVGAFSRRARVIGPRLWVRERRTLVASDPAPFVEMPLSLAHAFGGTVTWDGLEMPFPANPAGLGFNVEKEMAEGRLLPNLEEHGSPMATWDAQPAVCGFGFCPMTNPGRFLSGAVLDERYQVQELRPRFFNSAYAPMVAPSAEPGDVVRVEGVHHDRALTFTLPPPPFNVKLAFGSNVSERTPSIEQIGVEVEERRVFVTYRFPFRYTVRERELRQAMIVEREQESVDR